MVQKLTTMHYECELFAQRKCRQVSSDDNKGDGAIVGNHNKLICL